LLVQLTDSVTTLLQQLSLANSRLDALTNEVLSLRQVNTTLTNRMESLAAANRILINAIDSRCYNSRYLHTLSYHTSAYPYHNPVVISYVVYVV
jgi:hypothetical protein